MIKDTILGHGIYGLTEAARYTGMQGSRISAWFDHSVDESADGLLRSDFSELGIVNALSFLNLIEVFVVGQFRDKNVSLQEIRKAHKLLKVDLKTPHPFSHKDLYAHSRKVFAKVAEEEGSESLYQVVSRQGFSEEVMKNHLMKIDYSELTKLAERWRVAPGVVIDPRICLGKPVLEGRGISTHIVAAEYWTSNKNEKFVAELYGISEKDVLNAVSFQIGHGNDKAA